MVIVVVVSVNVVNTSINSGSTQGLLIGTGSNNEGFQNLKFQLFAIKQISI